MRTLARGLLPLVLCIAASPAHAEWRRIDSPSFVVVGDVNARALRDIAVKFEGFRETLGRVFGPRVTSTAVPTLVIVFPSDRAFTPFKRLYNGKPVSMSGVFVPRRDMNYIAVVDDGQRDRFEVVFHEYAHLMVSNVGSRMPLWLNEGIAEYYSTFELGRGSRQAVIGSPIASHLQRLQDTRLLPLDQLLTVTHDSPLYGETDRRSVFYAQSWALTHMILLGEPIRTPKLTNYLDRVTKGEDPMKAWQSAFAGDDMASALQGYIRRQTFRAVEVNFTEKLSAFEAPVAAVAPADVEAVLADFLHQLGRTDDALVRIEAATRLGLRSQRLALVQAQIDRERDKRAGVDARLRDLGDATDWLGAYLAGVAVADAAEGAARPDRADVDLARRYFMAAHTGRQEFANALARLVTLELRHPERPAPERRAEIERARRLAPGRHEYALLHAQVLARQTDYAAARAVLQPLTGGLYSDYIQQSARSLLDYVGRVEAAAAIPTTRASSSTPGTMSASTPPPAPPTVVETPPNEPISRPAFRELQAGEARLEGTLERIECVPGVGVVFHLRTPEGMTTARAAKFEAVDFITYRDDVAGSITCAPLKPPMPVYLTFRPSGPNGTVKSVVAVEFLPRKTTSPVS